MEWSHDLPDVLANQAIAAVTPYLARISEELRRRVLEQVVPALMNPIDPVPRRDSTQVFRDIVKQAAVLTNVHTVAVVHRAAQDSTKFSILAANSDGENLDDMEGLCINSAGTSCAEILDQDVYLIQSDLHAQYSDAAFLNYFQGEAYLAFGFRNSAGQSIGHIVFLHNRPMRASVATSQFMAVVASRAGQELQRFTLEQERDSMETALRVRSKLESLGTMAGTIAHDFNNQLTAMIGNTEMATLQLASEHPSQYFLKNAEDSMWRARDVIADIMDFAGNHENTEMEPVALGEVISSAISEFEPRLKGHSSIVSTIAPELPKIRARRIQIFQIISNLIANGLDALDETKQHQIEISVDWVIISASKHEQCMTGQCAKLPQRCIRVELRDQGRGMTPSTAERIFDPYFSTKGVSRGLGLSSVLGIAKRMQIGLTFDSKVGVGTTFRLYFAPLEAQEAEQSADADSHSYKDTNLVLNKTALVVDDEGGVQRIVSRMLTRWGYTVVNAHSGEEALTQAKSMDRIDTAVVDVVMPGIDGFETLKKLRELHPGLSAVMVSGFSEGSLSKSFTADEKVKFLVKPFGAKALHDALQNIQ